MKANAAAIDRDVGTSIVAKVLKTFIKFIYTYLVRCLVREEHDRPAPHVGELDP